MGEPCGIVVVPTEAGRVLTMEGPCGARAGMVFAAGTSCLDCGRAFPAWAPMCPDCGGPGRSEGLPLWWDGALVPEGWDRARRVAFDAAGFTGGPALAAALDAVEVVYPSAAGVLHMALALEAAGLCRVVVLDLVDGAVVERAP